jgi:hypothetical protein
MGRGKRTPDKIDTTALSSRRVPAALIVDVLGQRSLAERLTKNKDVPDALIDAVYDPRSSADGLIRGREVPKTLVDVLLDPRLNSLDGSDNLGDEA